MPREQLRRHTPTLGLRPYPMDAPGPGPHRRLHPPPAPLPGLCRTHVLLPTRTHPRRPDTVETVGAALLAAVNGHGYRHIAEQFQIPATTVRGWLQPARANSDTIGTNATIAGHALNPMATKINPTGSALGDMLDAVGLAVSAYIRRLGPHYPPWQIALALTSAGILAPHPRPIHRHPPS